MEILLARAIALASKVFEDTYDKGGKPYILHCLWVMNKVRHLGTDYMIVAVLHDLIEDTDWNITSLTSMGFPWQILQPLILLTHKKEQDYEHYISHLAGNKIAREVKLRDLEHNSKITRLKGLRNKDFERLIKYNKAYQYLKQYK